MLIGTVFSVYALAVLYVLCYIGMDFSFFTSLKLCTMCACILVYSHVLACSTGPCDRTMYN